MIWSCTPASRGQLNRSFLQIPEATSPSQAPTTSLQRSSLSQVASGNRHLLTACHYLPVPVQA